jgi:hypothetical protein
MAGNPPFSNEIDANGEEENRKQDDSPLCAVHNIHTGDMGNREPAFGDQQRCTEYARQPIRQQLIVADTLDKVSPVGYLSDKRAKKHDSNRDVNDR